METTESCETRGSVVGRTGSGRGHQYDEHVVGQDALGGGEKRLEQVHGGCVKNVSSRGSSEKKPA